MKALVVPGGRQRSWRRQDVERPVAGPTEVLVKVRAAGLNRSDLAELADDYLPRGASSSRPRVGGGELAGVVTATGEKVTGITIGDRVMAMVNGAFCETAVVDQRILLPIPDDLGWETAAALPSVCMTAFDALVLQGGVRPSSWVLVTGATSSVGWFAVQLALHRGAWALGTTRSEDRAGALRSLGAVPLVTSRGNVVQDVLHATGGQGADVVIDHVGGAALNDTVAATRVGGRIVQVGRLGGEQVNLDLDHLARRRVQLIGTTFRTRGPELQRPIAAGVRRTLLPAVGPGELSSPVAAVVPFEEADVRSNSSGKAPSWARSSYVFQTEPSSPHAKIKQVA